MNDQANPVSRPWRRFLRLSVRGMIVIVLVVGAGLGCFVRSAKIQHGAVAVIEQSGGQVSYDSGWTDNPTFAPGGTFTIREPWAPEWLVSAIGLNYFAHISTVVFDQPCTDSQLANVGCLTGLSFLWLEQEKNVTNSGLAHLQGLVNLRQLYIRRAHVSDAELAHLNGLKKLSTLVLDYTQISDAGLAHLSRLTNLSELYISGTHVSDGGLAHLKGLTKLSRLDLSNTQVSDAGLVQLNRLSNLSHLRLRFTQVTDAGIMELTRALPSLTIEH
jgi:Leucine Rich repeat